MVGRGGLQIPAGPMEVEFTQYSVVTDRPHPGYCGTALSLRLSLAAVSRARPLLPDAIAGGYLWGVGERRNRPGLGGYIAGLTRLVLPINIYITNHG